MLIARIILSILLALLFLTTGGGKELGLKSSLQIRESVGVSPVAWRVIGLCELVGTFGLILGIWVPSVGLAATAGFLILMIGAIITRVRAPHTQRNGVIGDAVVLVVVVVLGVLEFLALAH